MKLKQWSVTFLWITSTEIGCESNPRWGDSESTLSSVDGYVVQKEGQEERKILKEIETVVVERVRNEKRACWRS